MTSILALLGMKYSHLLPPLTVIWPGTYPVNENVLPWGFSEISFVLSGIYALPVNRFTALVLPGS